MAEAPKKKFKGIKAIGRVRTEETFEKDMKDVLEENLTKICSMYKTKYNKDIDREKVKKMMAFFKYAKANWDDTPIEILNEIKGQEIATPTTDKMLEEIDPLEVIQELKHEAAQNMEKVPEKIDPEFEEIIKKIMGEPTRDGEEEIK